jgi:hypothetical protein
MYTVDEEANPKKCNVGEFATVVAGLPLSRPPIRPPAVGSTNWMLPYGLAGPPGLASIKLSNTFAAVGVDFVPIFRRPGALPKMLPHLDRRSSRLPLIAVMAIAVR